VRPQLVPVLEPDLEIRLERLDVAGLERALTQEIEDQEDDLVTTVCL